MSDFLNSSSYFGVTVCIIGYALGVFLKKKLKLGLLNPLLVSIIFAILVIRIFGVDYENFSQSAKCLSYLLTPATVCLAAAFHTETALLCCPPWNSRRGIFQLGKRSGNGSPVWPGSHILCNSPPKIDHHCYRHRSFRGTWRYPYNYRSGYCRDRHPRKCYR